MLFLCATVRNSVVHVHIYETLIFLKITVFEETVALKHANSYLFITYYIASTHAHENKILT